MDDADQKAYAPDEVPPISVGDVVVGTDGTTYRIFGAIQPDGEIRVLGDRQQRKRHRPEGQARTTGTRPRRST